MSTSKDFSIKIDGSIDKEEWKPESTPPNTDKYEVDVDATLDVIVQNPAGLIVLQAIKDDDDDLTIVPYSDRDIARNDGDRCNALAVADKPVAAAPKDDFFYLGHFDKGQWTSRYDMSRVRGTGKGSDSKVHYTPDIWGKGPCGKGNYGTEPDEVLLHELVHGLRQMRGHLNKVPTEDQLRNYDDEEEFLAIVVGNIYISAKKNAQPNQKLRADHHGFKALAANLSTSAGFLTDPGNLRVLVKYYWWEVGLYQDLALVDCTFNPIRELVINGPKYHRPDIQRRVKETPSKQPVYEPPCRHANWACN
jgi:hypothetical protein